MIVEMDAQKIPPPSRVANVKGQTFGRGTIAGSTWLKFAPDVSFEEWKAVGVKLGRVSNASLWWLADWLFYGQWEWGKRYEEAICQPAPDPSGRPRSTLDVALSARARAGSDALGVLGLPLAVGRLQAVGGRALDQACRSCLRQAEDAPACLRLVAGGCGARGALLPRLAELAAQLLGKRRRLGAMGAEYPGGGRWREYAIPLQHLLRQRGRGVLVGTSSRAQAPCVGSLLVQPRRPGRDGGSHALHRAARPVGGERLLAVAETLFTPPPADGRLTERQELVLRLVREQGGIRDEDAVRVVHGDCPYCREEPCAYAGMAAREVLGALRKRGLVVRRRTGVWEPAGAQKRSDGRYDPAAAAFPEGF